MSEFILAAADGSRAYRLTYDEQSGGETPTYQVRAAHVTGVAVRMPSGTTLEHALDVPVLIEEVLVDLVLGAVAPGSVADYRSAAKAVVDAEWSA